MGGLVKEDIQRVFECYFEFAAMGGSWSSENIQKTLTVEIDGPVYVLN